MKNKMQYLGSDNTFVFGVVLIVVVVAWLFSAWHDHETKKQMQDTINNSVIVINSLNKAVKNKDAYIDTLANLAETVTNKADSLMETTKEQSIKLQKMAEMYITKFNEAHDLRLHRDELAKDNTKLKFENNQLKIDNTNLSNQLTDSLKINDRNDTLIDSLKLDNSRKVREIKRLSEDSNIKQVSIEDHLTKEIRKTRKSTKKS